MADRLEAPIEEVNGEITEELQGMLRSLAAATGAKTTEILKNIQEYAAENIEAWKKQKVLVGVVGESGAGKSTFINSFRGLEPTERGAASVGVTHTTADAKEYPHPERPDNMIFVDFPGVLLKKGTGGERDFDIQQYLAKFRKTMNQCQVFLVFSSGRIQHNAVQIGMKAREMGKKVLFVRSKFDRDLEDKQNDDPAYFKGKTKDYASADLREKLREDYIKVLKEVEWEGEVDPRDVFIISGRLNYVLMGSWDIPKLREAMIKNLSAFQKMVVINTCRDFSTATIKERGDIYRSKVSTVAMAATTGTFVPYAGVASIPGALVIAYYQYKEGFGLTDDAVEQLATMTNKSPDDLKTFLNTKLLNRPKLGRVDEALFVIQIISGSLDLAAAIAVDQVVDLIVPVIGAVVTAPIAYCITAKVLHALILRLEECASELFDYAFKETAV